MSQHKQPSELESAVTSEQELFAKWSAHPSPFVQSVLEDRRERLARGERLPSKHELDEEV